MLHHLRSRALRSANAALRAAGVQLERTTRHRSLTDFLASRQIDLVLDVGANQGQFGTALREDGYAGRIQSYEPLSGAFRTLAAVAARQPLWEAFNFGFSDREGVADINVSEYSVFSSLNEQTDYALEFNRQSAVITTESIALKTIDSVFPSTRHHRTFLKIDTQGHEQAVLSGAGESLASFHGVQMELPVRHLYKGVWQIEEAVAFMRAQGFLLSNVTPTNFGSSQDPVSLTELDCVFKNERLPPPRPSHT